VTAYWFKQRRFGYGATPVTWQGWMLMLVHLGRRMRRCRGSNASVALGLGFDGDHICRGDRGGRALELAQDQRRMALG
jgi:hypothetical protein